MTQETTEAPNDIAENLGKVQTELAVIDNISAGLAELNKKHPKNLACDVATAKGMKEAIAGRAAWRDPRIATEKARKAAKAPVLELGRAIDARAAEITGFLLEGESNYDDQIKAEEARKEEERAKKAEAERKRVATHAASVQEIRDHINAVVGASPEAIAFRISEVEQYECGPAWEEFQGQAQLAKDETLDKLRAMQSDALAREEEAARMKAEQEAAAAALAAERAELERLRAEQAERERVAAAEQAEQARIAKAAIDAAAKAQADKLAAERAEQEKTLAAERAAQAAELKAQREAQAKADAEAAAARKAEDDRIAAQLAELAAQREAAAAELRRMDEAEIERKRAEYEAVRAADEAKHAADKLVRDEAQALLDSLREVVAYAEQTGNDWLCLVHARAVIAKATGGKP